MASSLYKSTNLFYDKIMEAKNKIPSDFLTYDAFTRLIYAILMNKHTMVAKGTHKKNHRKKNLFIYIF